MQTFQLKLLSFGVLQLCSIWSMVMDAWDEMIQIPFSSQPVLVSSRPFGLVHVDYEGKTLNRTLKDSSSFFMELASSRSVPYVAPVPSGSSGAAGAVPGMAAVGLVLAALALKGSH